MAYDNLATFVQRTPKQPTASRPPINLSELDTQPCDSEVDTLRQKADRLSSLLKVMPAGVIVIDGQGVVREANDQAKDLLGEPLEGQLWRSIIARSFKPRADDGHEVSLTDGRRVKLSISPLENEPGQLIVLTDLTETRQLQARVGHLQRLSALGKMVASLAHQIRTPLSAAMLYAANLTRNDLSTDAGRPFAEKLKARLQELESQVNDMLLFAKSGEQQVVNPLSLDALGEAINDTALSLCQRANVAYSTPQWPQGIDVLGNLSALQGALLNLIDNACQVSPMGSKVSIRLNVDDQFVHIHVCDEGPGIPAKALKQIFTPFFTTKSNGTGLGLSVVHSVASAHKGNVIAHNREQGGAEFVLTLPRFYRSHSLASGE